MKGRLNPMRAMSPWLLAISLLLSSWLGLRLLMFIFPDTDASFATKEMVVALLAANGIHWLLHRAGHLIGGFCSGKKLLAFKLFGKALVREKGGYTLKPAPVETMLCSVFMTGQEEKDGALYWLGGGIFNLIGVLFSVVFLVACPVAAGSFGEILLICLLLLGLWCAAVELCPAYISQIPNDALCFWQCKRNLRAKAGHIRLDRVLGYLGEYRSDADDPAGDGEVPDGRLLEEISGYGDSAAFADADREPLDLFSYLSLYRGFQALLVRGKRREASWLMAELYFHLADFPEEWRTLIIRETALFFCLGQEPEELELADRLMSASVKKLCEKDASAESWGALFLWSLHHPELSEEQEIYRQKALSLVPTVSFESLRQFWNSILEKHEQE